MVASTPEEICELFKLFMQSGDIDSLLELYDSEAVFMNESGQLRRGTNEFREELTPLARAKATFDYSIKQVIQADDITLLHTQWTVRSSEPLTVYAIEVAKRQPDGSWRWLIGDPYTVNQQVPTSK